MNKRDQLKREEREWVDKFNRSRCSSKKELYMKKIIEYEVRIAKLDNDG